MRLIIPLLLLLVTIACYAQVPNIPVIDSGYFAIPVRHSPRLTGNFGELRDNHFHAGLDFKSSNGRPGDDILAVADGYISRIKVSMGGYGLTLYIDHPCGLTSVYAHLSSFREDIQDFVYEKQLEILDYEIDICPDTSEFFVKRGDLIGKMGSTGHSYGPHLHFELRITDSEIPINPLMYGFGISDDKPPIVRQFFAYTLDDRHRVLDRIPIPLTFENGVWTSVSDTISIDGWRVGLGVDAIDQLNGTTNRNGVYSINMRVNDDNAYQYRATHCSFDETINMNGHIDYARRQSHRQFVHRCFILPNNTLSMYDTSYGKGIIMLYKNRPQPVDITIEDYHGNTQRINLLLLQSDNWTTTDNEPLYHAFFRYDKSNLYSTEYISVFAPEDALFTDEPLEIVPATDHNGHLTSLRVGQPEIPVKSDLIVHLDNRLIDERWKEKACLVYKDHRSKRDRSVGGEITNDGMNFYLPYLGLHELHYDTLAPEITPFYGKTSWRYGETLKFRIKDNYEVIGMARELRISSCIGDRYVAGYYDLKSHIFSLEVKGDWPPGKHLLMIEAIDDQENKTAWSKLVTIN